MRTEKQRASGGGLVCISYLYIKDKKDSGILFMWKINRATLKCFTAEEPYSF